MISICIPSYNNPAALRRCVESVLMQDHKDFELIISDDSDNPETTNMLASMSIPGLIYHRNPKPLGSPANWNHAIQLATRPYVKMLHHDDEFLHPGALAQFAQAALQHPNAGLIFSSSCTRFLKSGNEALNVCTGTQLKRIRKEPEFLFFRNCIGAPSVTLFKKEGRANFDTRLKWLVDVEFYISRLKQNAEFVHLPEVLLRVNDGETGQITQDVHRNRDLVLHENLLLFAALYKPGLNRPKSREFFAELFLQFDINNLKDLQAILTVPKVLQEFIETVFQEMPSRPLLKRIRKRLLTSRYNKRYFKIERF